MSHHFDTKLAKEDPSLNVCDFYLFQGAPDTTVMAMTVIPDVVLSAPDTLHLEGLYAFRLDLTGDAREDVVFKFRFNEPRSDDIALFSGYIADYTQKMTTYAGSVTNPEEYGKEVVSRLCPDTLPYELGTAAAFEVAGFNGRPLEDDVMDVMLTLATNRDLQHGAGPDRNRIRTEFPYFGQPYSKEEQKDVVPWHPVVVSEIPEKVPGAGFILVTLRRIARGPCTRHTRPASWGRLVQSASRAAHAPPQRESSPGQDQPPPQLCVEFLSTIDIRDGDDDYFEFHGGIGDVRPFSRLVIAYFVPAHC